MRGYKLKIDPLRSRAEGESENMPATPWTTFYQPDDDREYLALLTELPLKSFLDIPGLLRHMLKIRSQLRSTPGVIGYSLFAKLFRKKFWTLSAWEDEAALRVFVANAPHLTAMKAMRSRMKKTRFVRWKIRGSEYPLEWREAFGRSDSDTS